MWRTIYWCLLAVWLLCAALNMAHISAGILTSYGADVTQPAWLYIATRSLDNPLRVGLLKRTVGRSPTLAALAIFLGSAVTELSQLYWPHGLFPGTFDPLDILAYGISVGCVYLLETRWTTRQV